MDLDAIRIRRAEKQDRKLARRIERLIADGRHHQAMQLSRLRERSFSVKVVASNRVNQRRGARKRPASKVVDVAERINPLRPSRKRITVNALPKKDGSLRYVLAFGREDRVRQYIVRLISEPFFNPLDGQSAIKGRGISYAIGKARDAIMRGYRYALTMDIENFFPSIQLDDFAHHLPVTKHLAATILPSNSAPLRAGTVLSRHSQQPEEDTGRNKRRTNALSMLDIEHVRSQRGIPQGSAASPIVAEIAMQWLISHLPNGVVVITYADDILVLSKTRKRAALSQRALERAARQHPAGNLSFKRKAIEHLKGGFDYLGYHFTMESGRALITPTIAQMNRIETRMDELLVRIMLSHDSETDNLTSHAVSVATSWCNSFDQWRGSGRWLIRMKRDISRATELQEWQ